MTESDAPSDGEIIVELEKDIRAKDDELTRLREEIERSQEEIELLHIRIDYYMKVLALLQQKDTER